MSWIKTIEADLVKDFEYVGEELVAIWNAIVVAEKQEFVTVIVPLIKQAALNLQNESPGLDARTFIPAVVAAVLPILPVALIDIEHTAIFAIASTIAGQLGVTNDPGNQGDLAGGVQLGG